MKSFVSVFLFLLRTLAWADISPTTWYGGGIKPVDGSVVTMESANVEIRWGTPCNLRAVFVMQNPSDSPQEMLVGFPMPSLAYQPHTTPDPLTISFDGVSVKMTAPVKIMGMEYPTDRRGWIWYSHKHSFAPGKTVVEVNTVLRASRAYAGPYRESLRYCLESGGKWAGEIGVEDVVIIFPSEVRAGQIIEEKPAGAKIAGNRVSWSFKNFKPKADEFDVGLAYVRPDVMDKIAQLRNELKQQPQSAAAAIKLAKHLLALGYSKSNSGFPPWRLTQDDYTKIASSIKSKGDLQTFANHYVKKDGDIYEEASTEWSKERTSLVQILADAGYRDESSQIPFVKEGEALLLGVLNKDKHNAEAWNVYLANYWRFSFAAYGHWFGMTVLSKKQASLIREAVKNCPKDECIELWSKAASKRQDSDDLLEATIKKKGYRNTEFPRMNYNYY